MPPQTTTVATPQITPGSEMFTGSLSVTMADSTSGAAIYYTTDGSTPAPGAGTTKQYSTPFAVSATTTVEAIAVLQGDNNSAVTSAVYTSQTVATPQVTPGSETFSGSLSVTISDSTSGAAIYYTTDGSTPAPGVGTTKQYSTPFAVSATTTVKAIAALQGDNNSAVASAVYTLQTSTGPAVNFAGGFSTNTGLLFNGSAVWNQTANRLTLTSGATYQAGSVFYTTLVNVQSFTNDFTFQLTSPRADGITFTIQNNAPNALGTSGGNLGYATIAKSVAVKFDLSNNSGEGPDSTGEYASGAVPTTPSTDMTSSGVNLHSGDVMSVHMTYNGTTLAMTITDNTIGKSFSTSWAVNIPTVVGASTAYVGFTGGTGALTATQQIATWSYTAGAQ